MNPLGAVFQNVLGNGTIGNMLGGGGGLGGLAETGVEALHTHSPLGKLGAKVSENISGGVLNAEGLGDAAGIVVDFYTGNWFGAVDGAKDLLENFSKFDITKVGHNGLLKMLDPSGNLKRMMPKTPGMQLADGLLKSELGQIAQTALRSVGNLAKALPDLKDLPIIGDLLGGGKGGGGLLGGLLGGGKSGGLLGGLLGNILGGKSGGEAKSLLGGLGGVLKGIPLLQDMFKTLTPLGEMGGGIHSKLNTLHRG
jgi:hypothetical protein